MSLLRPSFAPAWLAPALFVAAALGACSQNGVVTHAQRTVEIPVEGMTCSGCEGTICSTLLAVEGVDACNASYEKALVSVTYMPSFTDEQAIAEAIRSVGYKVPRNE